MLQKYKGGFRRLTRNELSRRLVLALKKGPVHAIGSGIYDKNMKLLMSNSDLVNFRHMIRRTDAGGSPTWVAGPAL